ncbi:MAG: PAS domain S-box protein [Candidatus Electrothrix sp. ATG2]|nr:PAS domain S-box protein [Candidatus Electrothrix sp. ATG2]
MEMSDDMEKDVHEKDKTTRLSGEILVVDDTWENLKLLSELLTSAGYNVRPTGKPEVALASALKDPPDLALLDVRMPGMDGFELCRRLKQNKHTASIPVIFISALQDESAKLHGFEAGGVDFITKPFEERLVLARVETHLRLAQTQHELETERNLLEHRVEKRTAELAMREAKFRSLVEQSSDWIWEVDTQGVYTYVGPNVRELLGYQPDEVLGKTPFDLMPDNEAEKIKEIFCQSTAEKRPFRNLVNRNTHKDGHTVILESSGNPIFDTQGKLTGYFGVDRDITERQQYQEVLEQQVRTRTAELIESERRLKESQAFASLGQWELDLVHDELVWSDEVYRIFEIDKKTFTASYKAFLDLVHPDDQSAIEKAYNDSLIKN